MTSDETVKLRVPAQDLDRSSLFSSDPAAVSQWVSELPMANLGQTTKLLYQAVVELNRCRMLPDTRFSLLELLRPAIPFVSRRRPSKSPNSATVCTATWPTATPSSPHTPRHLANRVSPNRAG